MNYDPLSTQFPDLLRSLINQYFGQLNERQLDYCGGISEAAERLMNLINDMLDLASIEAGKLSLNYQEVNLSKFLNSVIDLVYNRAHDQGLDLSIENQSNIELIYVDNRRLKHALFNLLTNAIKFTPSGGKVTLQVKDDPNNENSLLIAIKDTGVGISLEDQHKIFNLFQHGTVTNSTQMGAGLGLSLVKSLIELHGGEISLSSSINEGTSITCQLPSRPLFLTEH